MFRRLCFGGLAGALVFFCFSLSPSLLPRGVVLQGLLSGITAVIGYGLGSGASAAVRKIQSAEPQQRTKRRAWRVLLGATIVLVPLVLFLGGVVQNDVRDLMEMEALASERNRPRTKKMSVVKNAPMSYPFLQRCQGLAVTPDGDLVMQTAKQGICVSHDQGATWSVVAPE